MKSVSSEKEASSELEESVKEIVTLDERAVCEAKRRLISENIPEQDLMSGARGLRLGVRGGGCSGLSYVIEVDEKRNDDYVSRKYGFQIFVDRKSSLYLQGVELQYSGGFVGSGFKFFNPSANATCGCGESFSL